MKTKITLKALLSIVFLTLTSIFSCYAQQNLGASCGCPPVASRPTVNLSTKGDTIILTSLGASTKPSGYSLRATNTVLSCDTTYILDRKIFVENGKSLTIQAGTVIKGLSYQGVNFTTALIILKGAKIFALGTQDCPIVFTSEFDPMDGSYGIENVGKWGGILVYGSAYNSIQIGFVDSEHLVYGVNSPRGNILGFGDNSSNFMFGALSGQAVNNDNSGIIQYVSIRHAGEYYTAAQQPLVRVSGLTLASVGSATTLDHIEVVACRGDGFYFCGGTVNLKYASALFCLEDGIEYGFGYNGNIQFFFNVSIYYDFFNASSNAIEGSSKHFGAALPSNLLASNPTIYNVTSIGSGNIYEDGFATRWSSKGSVYNSIFSYGNAALSLAPNTYLNWINSSLGYVCNTSVGNSYNKLTINGTNSTVSISDDLKFTNDGNVNQGSALLGFDYQYTINTFNNNVSNKLTPSPYPILTTTCLPPSNGFFTPVPYRGAFEGRKKSWLSGWSYGALVCNFSTGILPCPTDLNFDGITNSSDFLIFVGKFGQACGSLPCPTDLNNDGVTNNSDFLIFVGNLNSSCQ
jgi:hypothetical protein